MYIYCTGDLVNNGIISMTARGARAIGQNLYIFKDITENFKYVSAIGGKRRCWNFCL